MTTDNERMNMMISHRLTSDAWDASMAQRVLKEKRKRRTRFIAVLSGGLSTGMAAILAVVILFSGPTVQENAQQGSFITQQVHGTYSEVFSDHSPETAATTSELVLSSYSESMIEEILAER